MPGGHIVMSTNFTVVNVDIAEVAKTICVCDTTSFTLTNSCHSVTWEVSPDELGGPHAVGSAIVAGTNCGTWTVLARSTVNTNCVDSASLVVVKVESVSPHALSAIMEWDDRDNNPDTTLYLVRHGSGYVTKTAGFCPILDETNLPPCWTFTGGEAVGLGKLQRRVRCLPGKTEFTAKAGCSEKKVTIIVYRAEFRLKADGAAGTLGVGHAWWELYLTPDAKGVMWGLIGPYMDEWGLWPDGWVVRPPYVISGPADLSGGDQGHPVEGMSTWDVTIDHLIAGAARTREIDQDPGTFHLFNRNCTTEARDFGNSMFNAGVPADIWTPWDMRDWLLSQPYH